MKVVAKMLVCASVSAIIVAGLNPAISQERPGGLPGVPNAGPPAGGPPPGPPPATGPQLTLEDVVVRATPSSTGRGAPYPPIPDTVIGADLKGVQGGMGPPIKDGRAVVAAENGAVPEGITPLARDIFNSDDFYKDRELWSDPRYYRCMSPWGIENVWGAYEAPTTGDNPPGTIAWGYCDRDYPRENIVSPYPYKTAQEQYEALMAEAQSRGGPTSYSYDNPPPNWSGDYMANGGFSQSMSTISWMRGQITQLPTYLSLLTPEYQQRMVQQMWHYAHNEVIWPGAFCWPDGYQRRWFGGGGKMLVLPGMVEINVGGNGPIVTDIYIDRQLNMDGRVPNLRSDTRQYYGDTIGFWDGEVLVTWTSNVKHWIAHGWFETSDQFQSVESYTPIDDKQGNMVGLLHEAVLYDPEALIEPVRIIERWQKTADLAAAQPTRWTKCNPTLFPIDGQQTPANPGDVIQYTVPDMSGRPWADVWAVSEQNMERPKENDVLLGFN